MRSWGAWPQHGASKGAAQPRATLGRATVFWDHPEVAMDNTPPNGLRGPVVGRKNYYGSGSRWSARLAAVVFTILRTLQLGEINPQRGLSAYLESLHPNRATGRRRN